MRKALTAVYIWALALFRVDLRCNMIEIEPKDGWMLYEPAPYEKQPLLFRLLCLIQGDHE